MSTELSSALGLHASHGQGAAVQRKEPQPTGGTPAPAGGTTTAAAAGVTIDPKLIIQKLGSLQVPTFAGASNGTFSIADITSWMATFAQVLSEAKMAAGSTAPAELTQAIDHCLALRGPQLSQAVTAIRTATVDLTNDSSVSKKDPSQVVFPTVAQVKPFGTAAAKLSELSRDAALPGDASAKATLQSASATAQDAALAILQSQSVVAARIRWTTGTDTQTPRVADVGKGTAPGVDEIFKDSGFSNRADVETRADGTQHIFDWCGMFVVSSYFEGPGLARQLRGGFYHTNDVQDFFKYTQKSSPSRVPMAIWAENQWWNLKDYHEARGSARQWTPRATIQAAVVAGGAGDIRPGDTCLIDHGGGNTPSHIVMVESYDPVTKQLVTIEGNTYGIHADSTGKAERVDDDHLKNSTRGSGTATGLHVRDMTKLAPPPVPEPGTYVVNVPDANVRQDDDVTKTKKVGGKAVVIPADTIVEVTELKDAGGTKFANVTNWGWTKFTNLGTSARPPAGAYSAKSGTTIWGVGRPSAVDFEDGHEYSVRQVPAELKTTSPADIKELAKKKGTEGNTARKVDIKK